MELDEIELDILRDIASGKTVGFKFEQINDKNGNTAIPILKSLRINGYIKSEQLKTGIGEEKIIGITEKGLKQIR